MECPKCGYERQPEDTHCELCGVDFGLLDRQEAEKRALKERAKKQKGEEEELHLTMEEKESEPEVSPVTSPPPATKTPKTSPEVPIAAFMEKDCPKCSFERKKGDLECPNCGLIYAKHEELVAKKEAEEEAKKIAEQKKFEEEKAKIQKELEKRVTKAQAKREEDAKIEKEASAKEANEESIKPKSEIKDTVLTILRPVTSQPKKAAVILIVVIAVIAAGWGGMTLFTSWQKQAEEKRVQAEKEREEQRRVENNKKIAADFRKNRNTIENHLRSLIDKRKFDAFKKEIAQYDIPQLTGELSGIKRYFQEIELYDKAKGVSGKEYKKNYDLYLELQKLNPDKKIYSKKITYYRKKLAEQKYIQAKKYFNKKKPFRSELKNALANIDMAIKLNGNQKKYRQIKTRLINAQLLFYEGNDRIKMAVRNDGLTTGKTGGQRKLYVWVKNTGSSPLYINVEYFTLIGTNNKKYKYNNCSRELLVSLQPGKSTQGYLYFYTSVRPKKLVFSHINAGTISRVFPG